MVLERFLVRTETEAMMASAFLAGNSKETLQISVGTFVLRFWFCLRCFQSDESQTPKGRDGGQGWIRTNVHFREQIYSLIVKTEILYS